VSPTLFISDLHLASGRPEIVAAFHAFLRGPAHGAAALYVLGDLFDSWLGDDQLRDGAADAVARAFAALAAAGTAVYLQRGNRDFLLGERFAAASGATLLADEVVHALHGTPTLIMHGDQLCTGDLDYQRFRAWRMNPKNRRHMLALPYLVRRGIAAALRGGSRRATASKPDSIMDVNADAVASAFRRHGVTRLIHGHTHRPARHEHVVDGRVCERWVLGDWYHAGSYLRVDDAGVHPRTV
jgi:UDP-2,3-diacylglucosamine hydrolase